MKAVCEQFGRGTIAHAGTGRLITKPLEDDLQLVAKAFVDLQEARHGADYDMVVSLIRVDVLQKIGEVRAAFEAWKRVRDTPNAKIFLSALLLQRYW